MNNNLVGKIIRNRYHIIEQIGRGSFGVTFIAEDRQCFNDPCVVKQFKPQVTNPQTLKEARRLFNTEAEILGKLGDHDRIPRLLAYFEEERDFFIVQELIPGKDLSQEIEQGPVFSQEKIISLLEDVLEILVFVEKHGVIHRDIKPSNLMRRKTDGKIVLIDFGSVKQVSLSPNQQGIYNKPTVIVGTENYIPIEQIMGKPGFYSDIHALGIVAIQALTGKLPKDLAVDRNGELVWQSFLANPTQYNPKLLKAINKAIRYNYHERYQSAQDFLKDIHLAKQKVVDSPSFHQTVIINNNFFSQKIVKFCLLIIGVVVIIFLFSLLWQSEKIQYVNYENIDYGIKINHPVSWQIKTRDDFLISGIIFISPLENEVDSFQESISVFVENLVSDTSLNQYTEESITEIKQFSDPNVSEVKSVLLGNYEGRSVIYKGEEQGITVKRIQLWTVFNSKAYTITYTAEPSHYDRFLPILQKMINSFDFVI